MTPQELLGEEILQYKQEHKVSICEAADAVIAHWHDAEAFTPMPETLGLGCSPGLNGRPLGAGSPSDSPPETGLDRHGDAV